MSVLRVLVLLGMALLPAGAAVQEEAQPLCANDFLDWGPGPVSVVQAQFEDDVDLSGEPAVIDILFVYTKWTAEYYGSGLREKVERMVEHASVMLLNSGANARLRLVGLEPAPAYLEQVEEEQAEDFGLIHKVLDWIGDDIPCCEAAELRARYGADLMYGLVREKSWIACGAASSFGRADAHAGWISSSCLRKGGRLLAHEVGHNLGLAHEPGDSASAYRPGALGFRSFDPVMKWDWGTIMSRAPHREWRYSSSRWTHNGRVIGFPGMHEATDQLRFAAPYAAAYKRPKHAEEVRYRCEETADTECMAAGRFAVRASYRHPDGVRSGQARIRDAYLGDTATLFYFFSADNPELLVKVLDGCDANGHYWVFGSAGTDLEYEVEIADAKDGRVIRYARDASDPLISDTSAFRCETASAAASGAAGSSLEWPLAYGGAAEDERVQHGQTQWSGAYGGEALEASPPAATPLSVGAEEVGYSRCFDQNYWACMEDGKFHVKVRYRLPEGEGREPLKRVGFMTCSGYPDVWGRSRLPGGCGWLRDATIGDNAALFYFFSWDNPEVLVKVLDGCAVNGHYWVFGSAATDLEHRVEVRDRRLAPGTPDDTKQYVRNRSNPLIADVEAFRCELD